MAKYIFKRLLWAVPTLFLIMCLSFLLYKSLPGDMAERALEDRYLQEDENYSSLYQDLYLEMKLNLPAFYVELFPSQQHQRPYQIIDGLERSFYEKLYAEGYSTADVSFLLNVVLKPNETSEANLAYEKLLASNSFEVLQAKLAASEIQLSESTKMKLRQLTPAVMHFPTFRFHGSNNQFHQWLLNILKWDFGRSLISSRPVTEQFLPALKWTLFIVLLNLVLDLLIALPLGAYNGFYTNSWVDRVSNFFSFVILATPKFWLAILLVVFFTSAEYGNWTNIFPTPGIWKPQGDESFLAYAFGSLDQLILPLFILVVADIAYMNKIIRAEVMEQKDSEYVKTAISKGVPQTRLLFRHVIPNALTSFIVLLVNSFPLALAGSLIIEIIFNIPGIGRLLFSAIRDGDWPVLQVVILFSATITILLFIVGDVLQSILNPKVDLD